MNEKIIKNKIQQVVVIKGEKKRANTEDTRKKTPEKDTSIGQKQQKTIIMGFKEGKGGGQRMSTKGTKPPDVKKCFKEGQWKSSVSLFKVR